MRVNKKIILDIESGRVIERVAVESYRKPARAKGGSSQTTAQSLPKWLEPYAKDFIESYDDEAFITNADGSKTPIGMPGNLTMQNAGFTPEQQAAFANMTNLTGGAQNLANVGGYNAGATLAGNYLSPESNPYLSGTFDAAARKVTDAYSTATQPGIMAAAQRSGQFGSTAMDEMLQMSRMDLGDSLNNLATGIYGGNYQAERGNQMQAMQQLPQTIGALYSPQTYLAGVGAQQQAQTQAEYDTQYGNAANEAEWPFNILSGFGSALGQAAGGGGTSKTTSSGGGMSVICTELHRQGIMDDATYEADTKFGESLPTEVVAGYRAWAAPVARAMSKSAVLTALIAPIAMNWAVTMRAKVEGHPEQETRLGRLLLRWGTPICGWIGRRLHERILCVN